MGVPVSKECLDTWQTGARTSDWTYNANRNAVEFSLAYSIDKSGKEPYIDHLFLAGGR